MTSQLKTASTVATEPGLPPVPQGSALNVRSFGMTDQGRVRGNNEDQFLIALMNKTLRIEQSSLPQERIQYGADHGYIFLVADGMGGHQAGDQASALALTTIEEFIRDSLKWFYDGRATEQAVTGELKEALGQADQRIFAAAEQDPALRGMGTTLTMAYHLGAQLFLVHVGDSRAYLLRGTRLYRITHDQTLVAEMVRSGYIPPEEAAKHPYRHVITSALGGSDPGFQGEVRRVDLAAGDVLVLCTDGLTDAVTDEEIRAVIAGEPDPKAACAALVQRANAAGGPDNITVVIARFEAIPAYQGAAQTAA